MLRLRAVWVITEAAEEHTRYNGMLHPLPTARDQHTDAAVWGLVGLVQAGTMLSMLTVPPTKSFRLGWLATPCVFGTAGFASTSLLSMMCFRCCACHVQGLTTA